MIIDWDKFSVLQYDLLCEYVCKYIDLIETRQTTLRNLGFDLPEPDLMTFRFTVQVGGFTDVVRVGKTVQGIYQVQTANFLQAIK